MRGYDNTNTRARRRRGVQCMVEWDQKKGLYVVCGVAANLKLRWDSERESEAILSILHFHFVVLMWAQTSEGGSGDIWIWNFEIPLIKAAQ